MAYEIFLMGHVAVRIEFADCTLDFPKQIHNKYKDKEKSLEY
jgi:hypothetical protein